MKQHHCLFFLAITGLLAAIYFLAIGEVGYALQVTVIAETFIKTMTAAITAVKVK